MSRSIFNRLCPVVAKMAPRQTYKNVVNYIPVLWASYDAISPAQPSLFSESRLKLNLYKKRRSTVLQTKLKEVEHAFMKHMEGHLEESSTNTVSSHDLDWILHTASSNKELHMAINMFKRYEMYKDATVDNDFRYDVVLMRLCHTMNNPDIAYLAFKEQTASFRTSTAFLVLMDLLFINASYSQLYEVYETALTRFTQEDGSIHLPWMVLYLAVSACYFQGTSASYSRMKNILADSTKSAAHPGSRTLALGAYFALKQNEAELAMTYLDGVHRTNTLITSLKVQTYVMLGRPDSALDIIINLPSESDTTHHIIQESLDVLVQSVETSGDDELKAKLPGVMKRLRDNALVRNMPLERHLTRQISVPTSQLPAVFKKAKGDIPHVDGPVNTETSSERVETQTFGDRVVGVY